MLRLQFFFLIFFFLTNFAFAKSIDHCRDNTIFNVGAGIYDITGPAAEEGMMGYGMINQQTAGLYQRLWARAFVIESPCNNQRIVFVNADLGQVFQGIKQQVIRKLQEKYGHLYQDENVLITATHEHSGPGGYSTYTFYNLTTLGFNRKHFDTIVDGIVLAIQRAHTNKKPAQIKIASGSLEGISFNRSPSAYLQNPPEERKRYQANVDTEMTLIRFDDENGKSLGLINWFPLHGVSMNNKNHFINGDNKGYAEYLFEKKWHSDYGPEAFVAAFAQAHAGDVSPNPYGQEGGQGLAGLKAIEKAGYPQYAKANSLFNQATTLLKGGIEYRHTFVAMDNVFVSPFYTHGKEEMTCPAAIGVSMLAGTQDGEGLGKQGVTCDTVKSLLPHFICEKVRTSCQGVKPIVLQTGRMKPYPWTPNILPLQLIKIGNLVIVAAPFELTTMTGRRIRETVAKELPGNQIVLSALANAYAGYVATHEEYQIQRYEGASTHFGPWTEAAIQQEFAKLAQALREEKFIPAGPTPPDLYHQQINLQPSVVFDDKPLTKQFGDIDQDVNAQYQVGDTVYATFWGAHPKNNYRIQDTFLRIQFFINGTWQTIYQDRDWGTEYHWQRNGLANSLITIGWRIPKEAQKGYYRIVHEGDSRSLLNQKIHSYTGYSSVFKVL